MTHIKSLSYCRFNIIWWRVAFFKETESVLAFRLEITVQIIPMKIKLNVLQLVHELSLCLTFCLIKSRYTLCFHVKTDVISIAKTENELSR